jgi:hypothetical protein
MPLQVTGRTRKCAATPHICGLSGQFGQLYAFHPGRGQHAANLCSFWVAVREIVRGRNSFARPPPGAISRSTGEFLQFHPADLKSATCFAFGERLRHSARLSRFGARAPTGRFDTLPIAADASGRRFRRRSAPALYQSALPKEPMTEPGYPIRSPDADLFAAIDEWTKAWREVRGSTMKVPALASPRRRRSN